ncbi:MAG: phosphopantetheine-binding protein [Bacteroidia bacterium]
MEAETQLKTIITELANITDSDFSWNHMLRTEIGLDSLDMVELIMICEKDFGVSISDREWQTLTSAESLRDLILSRLPNT